MKVAIDIDGTITKNPVFFKKLINRLIDAGDEVFLLTGGITGCWGLSSGNHLDPPQRLEQLKLLGIDQFTCVVMVIRDTRDPGVCVAKGEFCRDNNIEALFEDDKDYIAAVRKGSPNTQTFLLGEYI